MKNTLHNITEIVILSFEKDVNERLSQGWILLEIFTTCYDPETFYKHQTAHFVLGKPSKAAPCNED